MHYFGTDGIRGIPHETLSMELMKRVGYAVALNNPGKNIFIAYDTRATSIDIKRALVAGISLKTTKVFDGLITTTPALVFYTRVKDAIGIMITASHNSAEYNGIKIFKDGKKLTTEETKELEDIIDDIDFTIFDRSISIQGVFDINNTYIKHLRHFAVKTNLRICVDAANGGITPIIKQMFSLVSDSVCYIGNTPNGNNINLDCGSLHINNLQEAVIEKDCDIGFAFDGDADRVIVVDSSGQVYNGDSILYIIASYLQHFGKLKGNRVVITAISNQGLVEALEKKKIVPIVTVVGDTNVLEVMKSNNVVIGAEPSGHIILDKGNLTSDGLYTAFMLLRILRRTKHTLKELTMDLDLFYERQMNVKCDKNPLINEHFKKEFTKLETNYSGSIVVRKSGTENVIRIFACGKGIDETNKAVDDTLALIRECEGD